MIHGRQMKERKEERQRKKEGEGGKEEGLKEENMFQKQSSSLLPYLGGKRSLYWGKIWSGYAHLYLHLKFSLVHSKNNG